MAVRRGARRPQSRARARRRPDQPSRAFRDGLSWLFSERIVIEVLCDPTTPFFVRQWMVTRLVDDEAPTTGEGRMTPRDRGARIRAWRRAVKDAKKSLPRAWRDPDGRLWRGRPQTWPALVLVTWLRGRIYGDLHWKLYDPEQPPSPRKGRRPLGPPRQSRSRSNGAREQRRAAGDHR